MTHKYCHSGISQNYTFMTRVSHHHAFSMQLTHVNLLSLSAFVSNRYIASELSIALKVILPTHLLFLLKFWDNICFTICRIAQPVPTTGFQCTFFYERKEMTLHTVDNTRVTHQWNSQERKPLPECPVNSRPCKHTQQIGANDVMGVLFSA